jgi:hypothetical protein
VILRALARNPNNRWQSASDMADALDDVVHDARFQPTHLAQLLYELFPIEGGAPRPTVSSSGVTHGSTGSGQPLRSRTVPPVSVPRTASGAGAGAMRYDVVAPGAPEPSLKPKSRFPAVAAVLVLLAGGGGAAWKFLGRKQPDFRATTIGDPNRRFYIHVKSNPDGANIYRVDDKKEKLMGSTPVTLPIDLSGVSSVKLVLKKEGYEDYQQIVVDDTPLSISLTVVGGPPPVPAGAGGAAVPPSTEPTTPVPAPAPASKPSSSKSGSGRSHHRSAPKAPDPGNGDGEPKGEITE